MSSSANAFNLDQSKILSFSKELIINFLYLFCAGIAPVSQTHRSSPHSSGLMSPNQAFNSSIPGPSNLNPAEWDPCQNFLLQNISQSDGMEDVDKLLPDLITEDELDKIGFGDIDLSDGMFIFSCSIP